MEKMDVRPPYIINILPILFYLLLLMKSYFSNIYTNFLQYTYNLRLTMDSWKDKLLNARKTALVQGCIRKIHYELSKEEEMAEDYDMKTGELLVRKWKRSSTIGRKSDWEYEVGCPPLGASSQSDILWESNSSPKVYRQDSKTHYAWRIQPLIWPMSNYTISVEDNAIFVRTENKKYFKKLTIKDMDRFGFPLLSKHVNCAHANSTLMISYEKPQPVLQLEQAIYSELCKVKPLQEGETESCNQQ